MYSGICTTGIVRAIPYQVTLFKCPTANSRCGDKFAIRDVTVSLEPSTKNTIEPRWMAYLNCSIKEDSVTFRIVCMPAAQQARKMSAFVPNCVTSSAHAKLRCRLKCLYWGSVLASEKGSGRRVFRCNNSWGHCFYGMVRATVCLRGKAQPPCPGHVTASGM